MENNKDIFRQLEKLNTLASELFTEAENQKVASEELHLMQRKAVNLVLKIAVLPEGKLIELQKECKQFAIDHKELLQEADGIRE